GSAFQDKRTKKFWAYVALGPKKRKGVLCPTSTSLDDARRRAKIASELVAALLAGNELDWIERTYRAVCEGDEERIAAVRRSVGHIVAGKVPRESAEAIGGTTFRAF